MTTRRILLIACATLLITSPLTAQDATALKVKEILKARCYYCHGEDGAAEGGLNFILDHERLLTTKQLVPKEPLKSVLYRKIVLDDMPKDDDPLSDEEKQLIRKWIADGAPSFNPEKAVRPFINPRQVYDILAKDILKQPEDDRKYMRYFSIVHLYNAGTGEDELETYRRGLSKLVNSLSWGDSIEVPEAADVAKTIYRIDIRHYKWESESWDAIAEEFPYKVAYEFKTYETVVRETQALVPIVNTDWFVTAAAVPPLYHELLDMPETAKDLEFLLSINVELNLKPENVRRGRVVRAGFNRSGVSGNNRIIERHRTLDGPYWKSYDFGAVDGAASERNIFERPVGPGRNDGFKHDGGELIFTLPNGLQAYMLVDGKGKRIDKGPIEIVQDDKRPDRQVVNGLSCMSCHSRGLIVKQDQIRPTVMANKLAYEKGFGEEGLEHILEIYPGQKELDKLFKQDRDRFAAAVEETGGRVTETEPIVTLALRFEEEVDLARAAAEAGLPVKEFTRRIKATPDIARSLGLLMVNGGTVTRAAYRTVFPSMSSALRLDLVDPLTDPTTKTRPARIRVFEEGPEFVLIPAGKFIMGMNDEARNRDHPPHEVEITKPFYLAVSELTLYEMFALTKINNFDPTTDRFLRERKLADKVLRITGMNPKKGGVIVAHSNTSTSADRVLSSLDSLPSVRLAGYRFRLPTEAEWEYAARGGSTTLKWLGDNGEKIDDFRTLPPRSGVFPLRQKKPNPFGLYDILGTHPEIVSDFYDKEYYKISPLKDPQGPKDGTLRVVRGGAKAIGLMIVVGRSQESPLNQYSIRLVLEFTNDDEKKKGDEKKE